MAAVSACTWLARPASSFSSSSARFRRCSGRTFSAPFAALARHLLSAVTLEPWENGTLLRTFGRRVICPTATGQRSASSSSRSDDNGGDLLPSHVPVLRDEVLKLWSGGIRLGGTTYLVDGTVGPGGHAHAALRFDPAVRLLAMDRDAEALNVARSNLAEFGERVAYHHGSYADMAEAIRAAGFPREGVDGILVDLGMSSVQLDDPRRGFTFRGDGPLDMRFDRGGRWRTKATTAFDIVNGWSVGELADLFRRNDEPMADAVAEGIVRWRKAKMNERRPGIRSTLELRHVIDSSIERAGGHWARGSDPSLIWRPDGRGRYASKVRRDRILRRFRETKPSHPLALTRCFQALRIEVNREPDHLHAFLGVAHQLLRGGGTFVALSFQPGEDSTVMEAMDRMCSMHEGGGAAAGASHGCDLISPSFELLTSEAIRPSREEIKRNRRSRSARLRAVRCIKPWNKSPLKDVTNTPLLRRT